MKLIGPPKDLCANCLSTTHWNHHLACDCITIQELRKELKQAHDKIEELNTAATLANNARYEEEVRRVNAEIRARQNS